MSPGFSHRSSRQEGTVSGHEAAAITMPQPGRSSGRIERGLRSPGRVFPACCGSISLIHIASSGIRPFGLIVSRVERGLSAYRRLGTGCRGSRREQYTSRPGCASAPLTVARAQPNSAGPAPPRSRDTLPPGAHEAPYERRRRQVSSTTSSFFPGSRPLHQEAGPAPPRSRDISANVWRQIDVLPLRRTRILPARPDIADRAVRRPAKIQAPAVCPPSVRRDRHRVFV